MFGDAPKLNSIISSGMSFMQNVQVNLHVHTTTLSHICFLATSTQPELKEIQNELGEVIEWHQLGLELGVPHAKLKEIENDYPQNQRRKVEVLDWWCRNTAEVSWVKLAKAVEEMGYTVLAERLRSTTFQG